MKLAHTAFRYKSPEHELAPVFTESYSEAARQNMNPEPAFASASAASEQETVSPSLDWDHYVNSRLDDFNQR
jgi:hypothetical protein